MPKRHGNSHGNDHGRRMSVAYSIWHGRRGSTWWVELRQPGWTPQSYGPYPSESAALVVKRGLLLVLEGELVGPFEVEPRTPFLTDNTIRALFARHLTGVELGAYDRRIIDWAVRTWDTSTALVLLGLLARARSAAEAAR